MRNAESEEEIEGEKLKVREQEREREKEKERERMVLIHQMFPLMLHLLLLLSDHFFFLKINSSRG